MRQLAYEEHERRHRVKADLGKTMWQIRNEAKVSRTALAHHLGISDPHLLDMEVGNRTYQEKYIDDAIDYCAAARKRQKNLIKNQ